MSWKQLMYQIADHETVFHAHDMQTESKSQGFYSQVLFSELISGNRPRNCPLRIYKDQH